MKDLGGHRYAYRPAEAKLVRAALRRCCADTTGLTDQQTMLVVLDIALAAPIVLRTVTEVAEFVVRAPRRAVKLRMERSLWGRGCPVKVWDGPYSYRCGLGGDAGTCAVHGVFAEAP